MYSSCFPNNFDTKYYRRSRFERKIEQKKKKKKRTNNNYCSIGSFIRSTGKLAATKPSQRRYTNTPIAYYTLKSA